MDQQVFDDSAYFIDLVRKSQQRFVNFQFENDFFDKIKNLRAGPYSIGQIMTNPPALAELKRVSRGNIADIDEKDGTVAVRMYADNQRIFIVDFKEMIVVFNGQRIAQVLGVMNEDPDDNSGEIIVQVNLPMISPSVIKAYKP